MELAKRISKFTIVGLSALLLISIFLPLLTNDLYGGIKYVYLYESIADGSLIYMRTVVSTVTLICILIALVFGTLVLFSQFKNKDMMAPGLLLFACFCLVFIFATICHAVSPEGTTKKLAGYYLLFIASCLQIAAVVAYVVICLLKRFFENQNCCGEKSL